MSKAALAKAIERGRAQAEKLVEKFETLEERLDAMDDETPAVGKKKPKKSKRNREEDDEEDDEDEADDDEQD